MVKMSSRLLSLLGRSRRGRKCFTCQAPSVGKRPEIQNNENGADSLKLAKEKKKSELQKSTIGTEEEEVDKYENRVNHCFRATSDISPEKQTILLFPGQGSQYVGMGKSLIQYPNVRTMYERAGELLGYDLYEICTGGPVERLERTRYQQPALFVTSLAGVERLKAERPEAIVNCIGASGMSIGEYAALVFSGALEFEAGLELVKQRGFYMEQACQETPSGMLTVHARRPSDLNAAMEAARHFAAETLGVSDPVCQVSTFISGELRVVGGHFECLNFLEEYGKPKFSVRIMKRLAVEGAFHTRLMKDAAWDFQENYLRKTTFQKPRIPVYSNLDAYLFPDDPVGIRSNLYRSIYQPVQWERLMDGIYRRKISEPMPTTYEVGPSSQLLTTIKINQASRRAFESAVPVDSTTVLKMPRQEEERN